MYATEYLQNICNRIYAEYREVQTNKQVML